MSMSEEVTLTGDEGRKKIGELIKDIRICMMTTAGEEGSFDSRPMATQKTEFDGDIWFLTRNESGKVSEIKDDAHSSLLYSDPSGSKYVVAKGRATVNQDKAKIHELWNPMFRAWFPGGEDDPSVAVLKVTISEAQYWEASSSKIVMGAKYLAAAVTGDHSKIGKHGTVKL
jgi:general stress protein 26